MSRNSTGVILCGMNQAKHLEATIEISKKKLLTSTTLEKIWDSIRRLDP